MAAARGLLGGRHHRGDRPAGLRAHAAHPRLPAHRARWRGARVSAVRVTIEPASDGVPAHVVRHDPRARNVRIRVTEREGVVITTPPRVSRAVIERALRAHAGWLERRLTETAQRRAVFAGGVEAMLPDTGTFAATGEAWGVDYRHAPG
ncbi:MAG: M48 family metallopeptidase, partial [Actinobacteria bacterium]